MRAIGARRNSGAFASVPKPVQPGTGNRQCFQVILKTATVRKTVASANVKFQSAKC
jgi:hypothetical protein